MEPTLSKKIDIGPSNWDAFTGLSTDNYLQALDNLFECCVYPQQIQNLKILLIEKIDIKAKYRLKELNNESTTLSD